MTSPATHHPVIRHVPNTLTVLRLLAVPVFVYFYLAAEAPADRDARIAAIVFFAAAFTDLFDGYIARRADVISQFGKLIDPFADRLLIGSASVLLSLDGPLPWWAFLVVIWRDALTVVGVVVARKRILTDVNRAGKLGTAVMMAAIAWLLVFPMSTFLVALFWIGVGISAFALVEYWVRYSWVITGRDVYSGTHETTTVEEESSGPAT